MFELPKLPYEKTELEPYISKETLDFHHGKHDQAYVDNLNNLIAGTEYESMDLEEIIRETRDGPIFNNASQVWNHTFYFDSLGKVDNPIPDGKLLDMIIKNFESFDNFKIKFNENAIKNFGSGWTWLVLNSNGDLEILNTSNAETPLTKQSKPIFCVDVWEHAYYIDYRNARPKYLEEIWNILDWEEIGERV